MEGAFRIKFMSFYEYLAENKITDKGFEILRQGNWPNLKALFLRSIILTRLQ